MSMQILIIAAIVALFLGLVVLMTWIIRRQKTKPLNIQKYTVRWKSAQRHCGNKETWPLAIIDTDKILDDVLKSRRYKGKSMGERLMAAQREISNNDAVWYAHKLRNKLVHEENVKLNEKKVKDALMGFRQALRDLGALE